MYGVHTLCLTDNSYYRFILILRQKKVLVLNAINLKGKKNVLFNDALNTVYFTVIWRRTYGKGPFR